MSDTSPELQGLLGDPTAPDLQQVAQDQPTEPQVVIVPTTSPDPIPASEPATSDVAPEAQPEVPAGVTAVAAEPEVSGEDHYVNPVLLVCGCTLPVQVTMEHPYTDADVAEAFADLATWARCEACSKPSR